MSKLDLAPAFLCELAHIRKYLVPLWLEWGKMRGKQITEKGENMCRFTSVTLRYILGSSWQFSGGGPDDLVSGGFFDGQGWHGHHWITNGEIIVDLTASQFGAEPIIVVPVSDPRYRATWFDECDALAFVDRRASEWARGYKLWRTKNT